MVKKLFVFLGDIISDIRFSLKRIMWREKKDKQEKVYEDDTFLGI